MEKLSKEQIKPFNDQFIDQVLNGNVKEAEASAMAYTRNILREDSFAEKVITPIDIANDELDKAQDPEVIVKWCDREPDVAPAVTVPYGNTPDGFVFKGTRYPVFFARTMTPNFKKDISKLRTYDYDIRQILLEISTKDLGTEVDSRFMNKINAVIGALNTPNPLNGLGLPQYIQFPGLTRDNLAEAFKSITRLKVPFGPMQPDGGSSKGIMLMNTSTAQDFIKFGRDEAGGDLSQQMFENGVPCKTLNGVKAIYTIKNQLVPDGQIYAFSSEEFLGKYFRLQPLTAYMENKAWWLSFFQYLELGISIGNVKGACLWDFNG
jgi:hypothetical protein